MKTQMFMRHTLMVFLTLLYCSDAELPKKTGMNLFKTSGPESIQIVFNPASALDRVDAEEAIYTGYDLKQRENPFRFHAMFDKTTNRYYVGIAHEHYLSLPEGIVGISVMATSLFASRTAVTIPVGTPATLPLLWNAFEASVAPNFDYLSARLGLKVPEPLLNVLFTKGQQAVTPKITNVVVNGGKVAVELKTSDNTHAGSVIYNETTMILEKAFLDGVQVYPTP